ncbi:MAG: hypothetical protein PHS79_01240 [Patescibacteria group bacterium]|nr:hypothetical protein [Patescibacteria group bacterium]
MEAGDKLREMLVYCGANINEFKDTRFPTIKRFINAARRYSNDEWSGSKISDLPIVCLTRTTYRELVTDRTEIMTAIPALASALWIIFADQIENPFFVDDTRRLGVFSDDLDQAPIWVEKRSNYSYLVLTPKTKNMSMVEVQANGLSLFNATTWFEREHSSSQQMTVTRKQTDPYARKVTSSGTFKSKP